MSYIVMDSRKLEEMVFAALSRNDVYRASLKKQAIANAKLSRWNRFWWKIFGTPSDEKIWEGESRTISFEGLWWEWHTAGFDMREKAPQLIAAARHSNIVHVQTSDLVLFAPRKKAASDYRTAE